MEIITKEDNRSFRTTAVFLICTGIWVASLALVQGNKNSVFLGSSFTSISIVAFVAILRHEFLVAKLIWAYLTPILILISCFIFPSSSSGNIITYGDALIGGVAFVYYSFSEKENKPAYWALLLFALAICVYDKLIYANATQVEDYAIYINNYTQLKVNNMLHFLSIVYLVHIVRKNKFSIQKQLADQINRLRKFTEQLIFISKDEALYSTLLEESLHEISKYTSRFADVSRVSVWNYDQDKHVIRYVSGYNSNPQENFSALELPLDAFPTYTQHLLEEKIIKANDAVHDHKTNELKEYLEANKILSMMDCPFFVDGKFAGILCCEEQRAHRKWDEVDQLFCQAMTQLVSIAYYSSHRNEYYREILLLNKRLTERNLVLTEINAMFKSTSESAEFNLKDFLSDTESIKAALSEYSYKNSHQVRGPLSRILGLTSLYKKDESQINRNMYVDHIAKAADELDAILKEINILLSSKHKQG